MNTTKWIKPTQATKKFPEILILTDHPSFEDIGAGELLAGKLGREFTEILHDARIIREDCYITSVFKFLPKGGDITNHCFKKKEADARWQALGNKGKYPFKAIKPAKYLDPAILQATLQLHKEIDTIRPNIIIALGNVPLWALTGDPRVGKFRGTLMPATIGEQVYKILPTFHPSIIRAKWDLRPIMVADCIKAKRECKTREIKKPKRELWIKPSLKDIRIFIDKYLRPAPRISWDIETLPSARLITCIGFGTPTHAICIPLMDRTKPNGSYWRSLEEEHKAIMLIKEILELPNGKITQNGMYDMTWTWRELGLFPRGDLHDTLLLHHSLYPEMEKSLGFLGSIYTNETAWKELNPKKIGGKKDD